MRKLFERIFLHLTYKLIKSIRQPGKRLSIQLSLSLMSIFNAIIITLSFAFPLFLSYSSTPPCPSVATSSQAHLILPVFSLPSANTPLPSTSLQTHPQTPHRSPLSHLLLPFLHNLPRDPLSLRFFPHSPHFLWSLTLF